MKTYSTNYLATEFQIDRATAVRALRDTNPDEEKTKGRLMFSIATFARALEAHRLSNASNAYDGAAEGASESTSLTQARVRIANATAENRERLNLIAAGKLCPVESIANDFGIVLNVFQQNILTMPSKIADSLSPHSPKDRIEIEEIVRRETFDYMDNVQQGVAEIIATLNAAVVAPEVGDDK